MWLKFPVRVFSSILILVSIYDNTVLVCILSVQITSSNDSDYCVCYRAEIYQSRCSPNLSSLIFSHCYQQWQLIAIFFLEGIPVQHLTRRGVPHGYADIIETRAVAEQHRDLTSFCCLLYSLCCLSPVPLCRWLPICFQVDLVCANGQVRKHKRQLGSFSWAEDITSEDKSAVTKKDTFLTLMIT